eukprot:PhF_6_TR30106/c0_g1_i2/m.43932/K03283/HSPA1s; heat shock 70kDa protein 1/2/6/8
MAEFQGAIGIDLGTTYSCVAVFLNGKAEVIVNDQGNRTTPSIVAVSPEGLLVGDSAKNQAARNPQGTVYDAKRVIGRKFCDKEVQDDMKTWPFNAEEDSKTGGVILRAHDKKFAPEEVSSIVLRYLKECAERFLGKKVINAVVTVPAYFNDSQRERTKVAGQIAGLNVIRIVNEPTAAALAYGVGEEVTAKKNILVFDLGGGTFDVSIICHEAGIFEVKSTAGNTHLGGQDFDNEIVLSWMQDIMKATKVDVSKNEKVLGKLKVKAEAAKKALSYQVSYDAEMEGLVNGDDFLLKLSRAKFEDLNDKHFRKCLEEVTNCLKAAKLNKKDIDDVVMVGGSTRIPKIQQIVSEYFGNKKLSFQVNPDEAIALGAAIQASILSDAPEQKHDTTNNILLIDVASLSIGVNVDRGRFDVLIPRNSPIPCSVTKTYSTIEDNQTEVEIEIYEGERPKVSQNHLLGKFDLQGIRKAKRGKVDIVVTFSLDANGVLTVKAEEKGGKKGSLVVQNTDRLSVDDVARMIQEAEARAAEDVEVKQVLELRADVERRLFELKHGVKKLDSRGEDASKLMGGVLKALAWLEDNATTASLDDLKRNEEKLKNMELCFETLRQRTEENSEGDDRGEEKAKRRKKDKEGHKRGKDEETVDEGTSEVVHESPQAHENVAGGNDIDDDDADALEELLD